MASLEKEKSVDMTQMVNEVPAECYQVFGVVNHPYRKHTFTWRIPQLCCTQPSHWTRSNPQENGWNLARNRMLRNCQAKVFVEGHPKS